MNDAFATTVRDAAVRAVSDLTASEDVAALPHRELMRRAKVLISVVLGDPGGGASELLTAAERLVGRLSALQSGSGLFEGGDNVQSPPDSAFTINDACDVHHLLRDGPVETAVLRDRLAAIIRKAAPALLAGGVHTPNHRWELTAALARIHRSFPDPRLVERAEEWLAEGIDIAPDGFFSERSPNYATAVSIPSLLTIADILDRPGLRRAVERNLELTLSLIGSDGTVETLPSRRQDQGTLFPLTRYASAFRELAIATGRGDFAWAAELSVAQGLDDPGLLAELLLRPTLGEPLPAARAPRRSDLVVHESASLAIARGDVVELVVYGGSDYPRQRRIRSGLAVDPTFLRLSAGDAVLDSVRLSRTFFGLGPFRADGLEVLDDGSLRLRERVSSGYYGPLPAASRRQDGDYELTDEGRFSAAMSFAERSRDDVALATTVTVHPREGGVDLDIDLDGPPVAWSLELAFRPGGSLDAPGPRDRDGAHVLDGPTATYRAGGDAITVEVAGLETSGDPMSYFPGEDYAFLSGSDAAGGVRLLVGGSTPSRFQLSLTAERRTTTGVGA